MRLAVVAPLGPNPAALTELVWALVRQRGAEIVAIEVVLESAEARRYWDLEIAGPGAAWSELRAVLADAIPPAEAIGARAARLPDGAVPADARTPGIVEAMREPLWAAARAAQAAGAPVVFALSGGRWRASTALAATVFQLLARPEDALVDVRISDPVAAGGTGFFFPEQRAGSLRGAGRYSRETFQPDAIEVLLEPVDVPRLRPLLGGRLFEDFTSALAASEAAIAAAQGPRLRLDLAAGILDVEGHRVALSPGYFALYAVLADAARAGAPWVGARDYARIGARLEAWRAQFTGSGGGFAFTDVRPKTLDRLSRGQPIPDEDHNLFAQTWSKLRKRMEALIPDADPLLRRAIPQRRERGHADARGRVQWALDLPPGRVELIARGQRSP